MPSWGDLAGHPPARCQGFFVPSATCAALGTVRRVTSPEVLGRSVGDDELEGEHDASEFEAGTHTELLEDRSKVRVHRVSGNK
jgi:hypothetical protein